jgi:hypothetical protein
LQLTQNLDVRRQGRTVDIGYQLRDAEGRTYTPNEPDRPPRFIVYCNGRAVGSGLFEHG